MPKTNHLTIEEVLEMIGEDKKPTVRGYKFARKPQGETLVLTPDDQGYNKAKAEMRSKLKKHA